MYSTTGDGGGDRYRLRCYVEYRGVPFADLDEPDLEGCIQKCSNINVEFDEVVCRAVSFLQYGGGGGGNGGGNGGGLHCTLLARSELGMERGDGGAVSAVLVGEGGD